jgi:hypothetical protein
MDKFDIVDEFFSSKPITNCKRIKHYDIGCDFHVKKIMYIIDNFVHNWKKNELILNGDFILNFEN